MSRPAEHLDLRVERVSSHQAEVVGARDRTESGEDTGGGGGGGRVSETEELTKMKWLL